MSFKERWKTLDHGGKKILHARCLEQILLLFAASAARLFEGFHLHPRVTRTACFLPIVDEGKIPKNRDLGIFWHARHEFGYQERELDLCDGDGQRGDGAQVSNRSCNRITRSILSSYPPRFFALRFFVPPWNILIQVA